MIMDMPSLSALRLLLREFIERTAGGSVPSDERP